MPNIEFFGLEFPYNEVIKDRITKALKGIVPEEDVVITEHKAEVTDLKGKPAPFIRLTTTPIPELSEVVEALKDVLPVDMEVLLLQQFHAVKK